MRSIYLLCLAVLSACLVLQAFAQPPGLASCRLEWNFGQTCDDVNPALAQAIKDLSITTCPPVGELCKYTLFSVQKYVITASHKTPVREFVDDLAFIFNYTSDSTCNVQGFSQSEVFLSDVVPHVEYDDDHGTNYCNLHNLLTHTGLKYEEITNDSICTDYSTANCTAV